MVQYYRQLLYVTVGYGTVQQSWAQLTLSIDKSIAVDPLINGTVLIFNFEKIVNLTEEHLFLSLLKASALFVEFSKT